MEKLVPLTKIILTLATAVWSLTLQTPSALAVLCVVELLILLMARRLFNSLKAIFLLVVFAVMLGLIEYAGGGTPVECSVCWRLLSFLFTSLVRYAFRILRQPWCSN